jgi:hypothetical protein
MTVSVNGTTGITFNDASTQNTAATGFGFKNRIINGAMMIDQRNAGASGTSAGYTVDRWSYLASQSSKGTWQQNAGSVTPPTGFSNYLGFTSSSAYSVTSSDYFAFYQSLEGFNTADFNWGTANAATLTISFWVRSSLTGTFGGTFNNYANNRCYPFTYTISATNTWEQKSITIAGDTSGTWTGASNAGSASVIFGLGAGSNRSGTAGAWATPSGDAPFTATGATSVVGTSGATFYITGVQLEKGSTATSFDYRPYGTELALCQRYYTRFGGQSTDDPIGTWGSATGSPATAVRIYVPFPVTLRATPSITFSSLDLQDGSNATSTVATCPLGSVSTLTVEIRPTASGLTQYRPYAIRGSSSSNFIALSAEL